MKIRIAFGIAGAWLTAIAIMVSLHCSSQSIPWYEKYPDKQEILDFMAQKEIPVLVMPYTWWDSQKEDLEGSGIKVYVHTVNDEEARRGMSQGVSDIYSDDILPAAVGQ